MNKIGDVKGREKMKKKFLYGILSVVFCFCLLVSMTGIVSGAAANRNDNENHTMSLTYVNPFYADSVSEEYIKQQAEDNVAALAETIYYDTVPEAGEQVRNHLKERAETIVVGVDSKEAPSAEIANEIFDEALEHTGNATEGDYLKWQYGGWHARISYYNQNGLYHITITYDVSYYTNQAQEQQLDAAVSELRSQLDLDGKTVYEKVKTIYDYICENVRYDYENLNDTTYMRKHTAYAALIDKKAVCQGYAVLFYRLALEEGIDARVISGTGNGGAHAWNIVKIGKEYFNVDATWDAGRYAYSYFLKGSSEFKDHIVDAYSVDIVQSYPISDTDFDISHVIEAPEAVSGLKIGGRATDALRLNWTKNSDASGYIIEQNKDGKWVRIARIGNNSTVTYRVETLLPSTTYQFRICAFGFDGDLPLYSAYQTISGTTLPESVTGLKIGGRAGDALRLNWEKNVGASGYIVEQNKNGKWVRIARIGNNSTVTYRVEGLSASTTYQFRVQSFGFEGSTPLYSGYQTISGTTLPTSVTGLKIGGRATDALRLNWEKNVGASGYIVEQNKNGKWVRIARIGNNSTVTYRVEGLSASTTYQFRVQSFGFEGSTPLYSGYQTISGKTLSQV